MSKGLKIFMILFYTALGLLVLALCSSMIDSDDVYEKDASGYTQTVDDNLTEDGETVTPEPANDEMTPAQENALASAENYLEFMHFSKAGLIKQLSSDAGDGYTKADATWAVNKLKVNWNEQAYKSAQNYQEIMPMSKVGLRKQLTSKAGEGFTLKQANYAIEKLGL